ncbi:MAG: bifunctional folylpolyglutamate synthase/dihydrofolate synthase, partial [Eggerthellaceae bacterium]
MSDDLASFDAVAYINEPRWHAMSLGLDRIKELLKRLGDPQDSLCFVHVAGTNGKGSTSAMMASVLCAAGYKTGLFTSPYIERFEERIRVDGHLISSEDLRQVT